MLNATLSRRNYSATSGSYLYDPRCILHGSISTAPSCRPSRPDTAGSTNVTHSPDLVHLKLGEIQNYARALQCRNGPLGLMLVARIIAMVKVPTPTIGGRETRRAALLGGSDAVGVVLATCDRAGKSELVCSALDGLKQPKPIPPSDSGVAENPTDPSMTPYSLLDLGSGSSLDHLRNGAGAVPAKPMSTTCEVNGKGVIAAKEPADVTNAPGNPDGRGETPAVWWPERKEPSSPVVVEVGGDGGCRKQIVLLSWRVNTSSIPVQMEEGYVNSGYGGPRSPAMDMGDASRFCSTTYNPTRNLENTVRWIWEIKRGTPCKREREKRG
ncbi:hypothetical protein BKA70DRAFT_1220407 [Coprinopsis sp. MPI-PUGE-AT-0042]|nr:hypothetical protein BKA70DRAFT_1220407 [Coprinopsis sp. MPI-PUGE-AT-0042]